MRYMQPFQGHCHITLFSICIVFGQALLRPWLPLTAGTPFFLNFFTKKGETTMNCTKNAECAVQQKKIKNNFSNGSGFGLFDLYALYNPVKQEVKR